MISGRCIRRRGMDLLFKGVIVGTIVLFFLHMTTSHPKGGFTQQKIDEIRSTQNHNEKVEEQVDDVADLVVEKRDDHQAEEKVEKLQQVIKEQPVAVTIPRKSRKGEFYENILIHFDLKGAPPKVPYFIELLRLIAKGGATGILLEWEDMFPWTGKLEPFKNTDAYSIKDVHAILTEARNLQLDIVPLVQTFGHLEWILKYQETRKYRENDAYPQVLCLGNEEGVDLVKEALKQVIDVHKQYGIKYFHIGADEAFEFGVCAESLAWISKFGGDGGKQLLALTHLKKIAEYVKQTAGQDTTVLGWHDMLKDFQSRLIKKLELGLVLEPVVWDYSENIITMNDFSFSALAENFPTMWASSAYKGANYPSATLSDVRHYETNNRNWIQTKKNQQGKFRDGFRGIIITGWQRYDHLAGLCEILPIGTPSMILQLQIAINAPSMDQEMIRKKAADVLGCSGFNVAGTTIISNRCSFKGFEAYTMYTSHVQNTFAQIEDELGKNHHLMGWANRYNVRYNISQNWYHREMLQFIQPIVGRYDQLEGGLRQAMSELFFDNTIDEFIYENLGVMGEKLHGYLDNINRLDKIRVWPKRHFPLNVTKH